MRGGKVGNGGDTRRGKVEKVRRNKRKGSRKWGEMRGRTVAKLMVSEK